MGWQEPCIVLLQSCRGYDRQPVDWNKDTKKPGRTTYIIFWLHNPPIVIQLRKRGKERHKMAWKITRYWHNADANYVGKKIHMFAAVAAITFVVINLAVSVYIHTVKKSISCHIKYNWIFLKKILILIFGSVLGAGMSKFNVLF